MHNFRTAEQCVEGFQRRESIVGANVSVRLREDGAHPLQRWSDRVRFSQANGHDDGVDDALGLGWSVVALLLAVAIVE